MKLHILVDGDPANDLSTLSMREVADGRNQLLIDQARYVKWKPVSRAASVWALELDVMALDRPQIVCICGSTRFMDEIREANQQWTLNNFIVLAPALVETGVDDGDETKMQLDKLHLRKIEMSDRVYVVNVDGYIGPSTQREIEHAEKIGKHVSYMQNI